MKKHLASTIDSNESIVEKATSNQDVPKVKTSTKDIITTYNLKEYRWSKTNITVNIQDLTNEQQQIAKGATEQINNLDIINLTTTKKVKITIVSVKQNKTVSAKTHLESTADTYKNLNIIETATIELYNPTINNHFNGNYALELNKIILHESGTR